MNKKLAASALMSLILSTAMLAAQKTPAADKSSPEAARLTRISVHRGKEGVSVEIICSRPITPAPTMISDPSRLVLDFADTVSAEPRNHISVNHDGLKSVRIGVQPLDPPTTRVVLDLDQERAYQLVAHGDKLTVKLGQEVQPSAIAASDRPTDKQGASELSTAAQTLSGEHSSAPAPAAAASPAAGDSTVVPNAAPTMSAQDTDPSSEPKSADSQPVGGEPTSEPVQIASSDPSAAAAGSASSAENTENSTENSASTSSAQPAGDPAVETRPAADETGSPAQTDALPAADASKATVAPGKNEVQSSQSAPPSMPAPAASTQSLRLSAAKITPDLPPVTPPPVSPASPAAQNTPSDYVIGEQDVLNIVVWKERELSGQVVVRPDGKITLPLVNEIKVVGMTPAELQTLLTEKFKPFLNIPQVTVEVVQINSRKAYLIGEVQKTGTFPLNSSTTVLQIIAQAGGLRDFAKRKDIYILRNQKGHQVRYRFNYDEVIRGKNTQQNIVLQPGDMVVVP